MLYKYKQYIIISFLLFILSLVTIVDAADYGSATIIAKYYKKKGYENVAQTIVSSLLKNHIDALTAFVVVADKSEQFGGIEDKDKASYWYLIIGNADVERAKCLVKIMATNDRSIILCNVPL